MTAESQLRPLPNRILARRVFERDLRESTLIEFPDSDVPTKFCDVVAVGSGEDVARLGVRPGDRVVVRGNVGRNARFGTKRDELLLALTPDEVEAVVEP